MNLPTIFPATVDLLFHSYCIGSRDSWCVLKASGSDIRDYLQGQITQDMKRLEADQAIHSLLLTPQGKAVSELYLLEGNDGEIVMLTPRQFAEETVARLRRFSIGRQLRIGVVDTLAVCSVQGANAVDGLALFDLPEPAGDSWLACSRLAGRDRFALLTPADPRGFWVIGERAEIDAVLAASDKHIGDAEIDAMRIVRGVPQLGIDWDQQLHPLNANADEFDAISFTKGCYVGQEVTSRMHWRGGIKKKLYRLQIDGMPDALPCAVRSEQPIGELSSAALTHNGQCYGIALLPVETVEAGKPLQLANGAAAKVLEPCHG